MSTIYTRATKGSALTWTEGDANINNLNTDKLENVVEDTTPQLGGNLDVQANDITTSVTDGDITIAPNGDGIVVIVSDLMVGYGTGTAAITSAGAYDLDLVTNGGTNSGLIRIVDGANGNIELTPNGTGDVQLNADTIRVGDHNSNVTISSYGTGNLTLNTHTGTNSGIIRINQGNNGNIEITPDGTGKISLDGLLWPNADGTNGQVLTTNGTGTLSFSTVSGGSSTLDGLTDVTIASVADGQLLVYNGTSSQWENITVTGGLDAVEDDTTPILGGDLDVGGNSIVSVSNGNIVIAPNGSGKTVVAALNYNEGAIHTVTYASTITPNVTNGNVQTVTLTGNVTFNAFASPVAGQSLTLKVVQDATGSRLLTSTMKFAGASKTLSTAANSIDIISVYYDGTDYFASLAKGFA
jgi:hypothetical protein